MKTPLKIGIVALLAVAVIGTVALKMAKAPVNAVNAISTVAATNAPMAISGGQPASEMTAKLPKLIDLGADKCIPCKTMAPILEELRKETAGRLDVVFIDVWKDPDAGKSFGIEMIPTQIFLDAEGKERFRHTGFFGKKDILGKWKELGVDLSEGKASAGTVHEEVAKPGIRP